VIQHVFIARYAYSESETFLFGLHRAPGERRFSDADVAGLGALLPVLGSTLSRMRLAEAGGQGVAGSNPVVPTGRRQAR
jgi:hypothetical protein